VGEVYALFDNLFPETVIDCTHDYPILGVAAKLFIKIPFDDAPLLSDDQTNRLIMRLSHIARFAALLIRSNERILVHCNAGENRSSLLDGLILLELRSMGIVNFTSVVDYIRSKRPGALQNKSFAAFLDGQCGLS
jgi:hypothetical protein